MSQVRTYNLGDALTSQRINATQQQLSTPGVHSGYDVTRLDDQTVQMSTGYLLLPNGILLSETAAVNLYFPTLPSTPTNYTIAAIHTDAAQIGGVAATYTLITGFQAKGSISNGTVIAWLFHPGGAAPIQNFMIVQPEKEKLDSFVTSRLNYIPIILSTPFPSAIVNLNAQHLLANTTGPISPVQVGTGWPLTTISSGLGGFTSTFVYSEGVLAKPSRIDIVAKIDAGCTLNTAVIDTTNTSAVISPSAPIDPLVTPAWSTYQIKIPVSTSTPTANGDWTVSKLWRLEVGFTMAANKTCSIASIVINYDPTLSI